MRIADLLSATPLPRSEAEILLARLLKRERTWVMAHSEYALTEEEKLIWEDWERRRGAGEPAAYLTGEQEFYGRRFLVDRRVLIPRPATETLIDVALAWLRSPHDTVADADAGIVAVARVLRLSPEIRTVVDVGTGSGAISVILALERPDLAVIATDASADALDVATDNVKLWNVADRVTLRRGNLLDPVADLREPFLLVANPPYVSSDRTLPRDIADFEPRMAIFAGPDGLDVIRPLMAQATHHPSCCGFVLECETEQWEAIDSLLP